MVNYIILHANSSSMISHCSYCIYKLINDWSKTFLDKVHEIESQIGSCDNMSFTGMRSCENMLILLKELNI